MIAVIQRVSWARVTVAGETVAAIPRGIVALVGVRKGDDPRDAAVLADRIARLRIFEDERGRMNRSLIDLGLSVLIVSQFTLLADLRKGRRPGFDAAEEPDRARVLLRVLVEDLTSLGLTVREGRFGATMEVELVNRGPATFVLDSQTWRKSLGGSGG